MRLKAENWEGVEEDCSDALKLDPFYLKAWQRRGTARRALKQFLEAAQDFEEALRCDNPIVLQRQRHTDQNELDIC